MTPRLLLAVVLLLAASAAARSAEPAPARVIVLPGTRVLWLAVTPDSKQVLVACDVARKDGDRKDQADLMLWDVATGGLVAGPVRTDGASSAGAVSPDGARAVTGDGDGRWRAWGVPGLNPGAAGKAGGGGVDRVAFAPGGKQVVLLLADSRLRLRDPFRAKRVTYTASVVAPDGAEKVAGDPIPWPRTLAPGDKADALNHTAAADWPVGAGPAFGKDGRPVPPTGDAVRPLAAPGNDWKGDPRAFALSPDRTRAATVGSDGLAVVWDYPKRRPLGAPLAVEKAFKLAFSADGSCLAVVHETGPGPGDWAVTVVAVESRAVVAGPLAVRTARAPTFTPDGAALVVPSTRAGAAALAVWPLPAKK